MIFESSTISDFFTPREGGIYCKPLVVHQIRSVECVVCKKERKGKIKIPREKAIIVTVA